MFCQWREGGGVEHGPFNSSRLLYGWVFRRIVTAGGY